jgi:hypothetical protein
MTLIDSKGKETDMIHTQDTCLGALLPMLLLIVSYSEYRYRIRSVYTLQL